MILEMKRREIMQTGSNCIYLGNCSQQCSIWKGFGNWILQAAGYKWRKTLFVSACIHEPIPWTILCFRPKSAAGSFDFDFDCSKNVELEDFRQKVYTWEIALAVSVVWKRLHCRLRTLDRFCQRYLVLFLSKVILVGGKLDLGIPQSRVEFGLWTLNLTEDDNDEGSITVWLRVWVFWPLEIIVKCLTSSTRMAVLKSVRRSSCIFGILSWVLAF